MEAGALVSVIVGSYNGSDFLCETIDSILAQTYGKIELILVDDGSKDDTWAIMRQYENKDSRVSALHQKNSGASSARETGYRASTGDYVILADDDDVWSPHLLEDMMALTCSYMDADVIATFNRRLTDFSEISAYDWVGNMSGDTLGKPQMMSGHDFRLTYLSTADVRPGFFWGMLFRRDFMDKMAAEFVKFKKKIPTHYFNDSFCACKVAGMANKIVVTNQVHILYRVSPSSLCHKSTVSLHVKHYIYALEEELAYYKQLGWKDVYDMLLPGGYLVLLRSWFMVYAYEKDEKERQHYFSEVRRLYDAYMDDLRGIKRKNAKEYMVYWSILLWNRHPRIWFRLIRILRGW